MFNNVSSDNGQLHVRGQANQVLFSMKANNSLMGNKITCRHAWVLSLCPTTHWPLPTSYLQFCHRYLKSSFFGEILMLGNLENNEQLQCLSIIQSKTVTSVMRMTPNGMVPVYPSSPQHNYFEYILLRLAVNVFQYSIFFSYLAAKSCAFYFNILFHSRS